MTRPAPVLAFAVLSLLGACRPAGAVPLTFEFQGVVTDLTADNGLFGPPGTAQIGDPFSGHFTYEFGPGNPDQSAADPELGEYNAIELIVDEAVVPLSSPRIAIRHRPPLGTFPPDPPDPGLDAFELFADAPGYAAVVLRLAAPFGAVFADDSLPADLVLASFTDNRLLVGLVAGGLGPSGPISDVGQLQSLRNVPEAGTSLLLGIGLLVMTAFGVRAKAVHDHQPDAKVARIELPIVRCD
jgi:hypothetical protein